MRASRQKKEGAVIVKVEGGLGNQLFIYAAAKRLAVRNDVPLRLDVVSGYIDDIYGRAYCLDRFNIDAEVASLRDSYMSAWGEKRRYLARKINSIIPFTFRFYIKEEKPFDPRLLELKVAHKVYLQGYWQDERYFKDIETIIRKDFTFVDAHDEENNAWRKRIAESNAVCLHARRKDYEHALPMGYYEKAIEYITERVENPHFYCFSDDPEWIIKNLTIDFPVNVVVHNKEEKGHEDLWLMKQCKYYIIANSSLSWWGAWLNPNLDKIVVAPARWGYDTRIPESWKAMGY